MENLTLDQQAVILKGIASQILQMNKPSFKVVGDLFKEFDIDFEGIKTYEQLYRAVGVALDLNDEVKTTEFKSLDDLQHRIAHYALQPENDTEFKISTKVLNLE